LCIVNRRRETAPTNTVFKNIKSFDFALQNQT